LLDDAATASGDEDVGAYSVFRNALSANGDGKNLPMWQLLLFGASSGGLGQLIASPADLVKGIYSWI